MVLNTKLPKWAVLPNGRHLKKKKQIPQYGSTKKLRSSRLQKYEMFG